MSENMRVMSEKPLNAETPVSYLRSWITPNAVFFDRNQGEIPPEPISTAEWRLEIDGLVESPVQVSYEEIIRMPKAVAAVTLECSGNGRSLLMQKASGNPWTVGGVGNAVWGGIWLRDVLARARPKSEANHVAFHGMDKPLGSAGVSFVRSIPFEKAMSTTLLAYEMNGEPLPLKHGYPLRALALGWTGANCAKWLKTITVLDQPHEGFFMDKVYRVFQKDQESTDGSVVTAIKLKSIITQPVQGESLSVGPIAVLGSAYSGESQVEQVDVSVDNGQSWQPASFLGLRDEFAWRQWQYVWEAKAKGDYTIMVRAIDADGNSQPLNASWNVLGYGNNAIEEHAIQVHID